MKISKLAFFTNLCIVIIYIASISQLIYTEHYLEQNEEIIAEDEEFYLQFSNKHGIAVGKKNIAGQKAWEYFHKNYIPKMFKECNGYYYSINQHKKAVKIPCTAEWWLCILQDTQYKYVPYYKIDAYKKFAYYSKIISQKDGTLTLEMQLQAIPFGNVKHQGLFTMEVVMNYKYDVLDIYSKEEAKEWFPVFGKGIYPRTYSCESLTANIGEKVNL